MRKQLSANGLKQLRLNVLVDVFLCLDFRKVGDSLPEFYVFAFLFWIQFVQWSDCFDFTETVA